MMKTIVFRPKIVLTLLFLLTIFALLVCFQSIHDILGTRRLPSIPVESRYESSIRGNIQPEKPPDDVDTQSQGRVDECKTNLKKTAVNIDTTELYRTLNFSQYETTYWNTYWEERHRKIKANPETLPLRVIVVPHSHNDPGWLFTFEEYFMRQTSHILNNMYSYLQTHPDFKFVWSEMSLFARWWKTLDNKPEIRPRVAEMVQKGQLELLTGGWVMTDEAGVNLYSMLDQLIEGHQWIKAHLGEKALPKNGWSIDPFGHGNAVPYLLRRSGIHNTFIQRTHYGWKRLLGNRQQLEFLWETTFQRQFAEPLVCHVAQYDLYSIKHTCGPDSETCLRFDFRRVHGEHSDARSEPVNPLNRLTLATTLVNQYSRLASSFKHNVALVLLGDDFRFDQFIEWEQQHTNYKKLFDYINDNPKQFNDTHVSFGTLSDYWNEVFQRQRDFPKLSGDFMPYGDVYAEGMPNYWTGYYTTRPFYKQLARELQHYLRAAEILYSLGRQNLLYNGHHQLRSRLDADYILLTGARNQMGIFQHHDAITGTSKEAVMRDYGQSLYDAINDAQSVIAHIIQYLQIKNKPLYQPVEDDFRYPQQPFTTYLTLSSKRSTFESLPAAIPLRVNAKNISNIVIFNSQSQRVKDIVRLQVTGPVQKIIKRSINQEILFQMNPVWEYSAEIATNLYELVFIADLPPLSTVVFDLVGQDPKDTSVIPTARVKLFISDAWDQKDRATLSNGHIFNFENSNQEEIISLTNKQIHATFSSHTGFLQSINDQQVKLSFGSYRSADFHSGAYLFRPDANRPLKNITGRFPVIRIVEGSVMSEVIVVYPDTVMQRVRIYHSDDAIGAGVELETSFDVSVRSEYFELFMAIDSNVASGQTFYTDSAGFEVVRRLRNDLLPVEANYYPMTESAFLEDDRQRLTVLTDHAHGVTSKKPGNLEIMLERKLRFDDARGVGEGVMDNRHTKSKFWIMVESLDEGKVELPTLSRTAHYLSQILNFPAIVLQSTQRAAMSGGRDLFGELRFLAQPTSCDVHLLTLRSLPSANAYHETSTESLMVLQNRPADCRIKSFLNCDVNEGVFFHDGIVKNIRNTILTGSLNGDIIQASDIIVPQHELMAFRISFETFGERNSSWRVIN